MADKYVGFIDAGVLRRLRRGDFHPQGTVIIDWFRGLAAAVPDMQGERFLRVCWYDGEYDPSHEGYNSQRGFFRGLGRTPGLQLRLGHLVERSDDRGQKRWEQKGVDTLLSLDLVRLSRTGVCVTAVLMTHDRDFADAISTAQDYGVRVLLATPKRYQVADELYQIVDGLIEISREDLDRMLPRQASGGRS